MLNLLVRKITQDIIHCPVIFILEIRLEQIQILLQLMTQMDTEDILALILTRGVGYFVWVFPRGVRVISSNTSVVSCVGSVCSAVAGGTANLTVNFAATTARAWLGSMLGVALQAGGPTAVPATATVIPVTIIPAANQIPTATITTPAGSVTRTTSDTLILSGTGTDTDGSIASYEWTYGGCGVAGSHISWSNPYDATAFFNVPGTFTVYLTVTDNQGAKSTNCPSRVITVVSPPVISFFFSDTTPINAGDSAILYWNAYGSGTITCNSSALPVNALWSGAQSAWSNGFVASPLSADTTFTLTCINAYGSDTKTTTVTVTTPPTPPTAIIVPSTEPITIPLGSQGPSLNGYYTTETNPVQAWTNTTGDNSWNLGSCNGPMLSGLYYLQNINYNIPGALEGISYKIYYSVKYNGVWSTNCPFRTIIMGPPTPTQLTTPINVSATPACNSAVVSWSAVPNAMSYDVYRCTGIYCEDTATFAYSKKGNTTTTSFVNTGLVNGTTYFYRVQAKPGTNPYSDSNWSDIPPASVAPSCTVSTCNSNNVCESTNGENPLTCPKDCKVKYRQF